jgi:predicted dehydrogenase
VAAAREEQRAAALAPVRAASSRYEYVLDDPDVEVAYVSLTNDQHHRWITAGLQAGKHVVCEKPLTLSGVECREVLALAEAQDRLLVEATWTRWHPRHRRAGALIASGDLGELQSVHATFTFTGIPDDNYRLDPTRGGGALLDLGPYVLAAVTDWHPHPWQVGDVTRQRHGSGVDVSTRAALTSAGGATASAHMSFVAPEHQELEVKGSELTLRWDEPAFTSWRAPSALTVESATDQWRIDFPACDAYQEMVSAVSRRVRGEDGDGGDGGDDRAYLPDPQLSARVADLVESVAAAPEAR